MKNTAIRGVFWLYEILYAISWLFNTFAEMPTQPIYTEQMLQTLNEAIATGARSVYYGDKRVEYRSLDDMLRIQHAMMVALGLVSDADETRLAVFDKGFRPCNRRSQGGPVDFDEHDTSFNPYI